MVMVKYGPVVVATAVGTVFSKLLAVTFATNE